MAPSLVHDRLNSLRVQAIIWLLLPFALTLGVILAVSVVAYQQVIASLIIARDQELATVAAQRLSEKLENYAGILSVLSNDPKLRSTDPAQRIRVLRDAALQLRPFDGGVYVLDGSGRPITTFTQTGLAAAPVNLDPYFRSVRATQAPAFSDILDQPDLPDSVMAVLVPILAPNGDFSGVLVGTFSLHTQQLGADIKELHIGEQGQAFLVDRQGRAIYYPDATRLGVDLRDQPVVQRVLQGDRGALVSSVDGQDFVFGYASVAASGWGLVIQESFDALVAPIRPYLGTALIVLGIGLLLGLFWLPLGVRRITEPIDRLAYQATRLASSNEAIQVEGGSIRELRMLAEAFNDMAQQVASSRAGQRSYVAMVTRTQEEERRRIARELHDGTVQALVAIGRRLELLAGTTLDPEMAAGIRELRDQVSDTASEVRRFSRELRPLVLEDLGLLPALRYLATQLSERTDTKVDLNVRGSLRDLQSEQELVLFRIFQEALANVAKHAHATEVQALLESDAEGILLQIDDNGDGFDPSPPPAELAQRGHFGLMGIQERAQLLGGRMEVRSAVGAGSSVRVWLPVELPSPNGHDRVPMPL